MRRRDFQKLVPKGWTVEKYDVRARPENLDHGDTVVTVSRDNSDDHLGLWADKDGELEWFLYDDDGHVDEYEGPTPSWTVDEALRSVGDAVRHANALEKEYKVTFTKNEYVKAYSPNVAIMKARSLYLDEGYREADITPTVWTRGSIGAK